MGNEISHRAYYGFGRGLYLGKGPEGECMNVQVFGEHELIERIQKALQPLHFNQKP